MATDERRSLAELPQRLRAGLTELREHWQLWRDDVRANPRMLWHSTILRAAVLTLAGIVLLVLVYWFAAALSPGGPTWRLGEGTRLATLYVACANPACRARYTTHQPMDFKAWPLKCEKCGQGTLYRATRCGVCRRWYALKPDDPPGCPFCAEKKAAEKSKAPPSDKTKRSDDAEDPW